MTPAYPRAPRTSDVERVAGLSFPDPFRPLENDEDPKVLEWQKAQAELADAHVAGLPGFELLRESVTRSTVEHLGWHLSSIPRYAGGRWFRFGRGEDDPHAQVVVADAPVTGGHAVFNASQHPDEHGRIPSLSWLSPSPDGTLVAVGLSFGVTETNVIRVIEVESGRCLDDRPPHVLMDSWMGGAQWLADSSGFFYVALHGPMEAFDLRIYRHDIAESPRMTPEILPPSVGSGHEYMGVFVSRDGHWAVASRCLSRPEPVAVLDLTDSSGKWRPFIEGLGCTVAGHVIGDEYIAVTDHDAPRGRLVAVPMASRSPADPASWRVVVPESDAVLRTVTPVGDFLYLSEFVDTYARLRIVDPEGTEVGQVALPDKGALADLVHPLRALVPRGHPNEYVFGFSSLTKAWGIYRHRPGHTDVETLKQPETQIDAVVEDHWATSPDGTRVPYHLVRRSDVMANRAQPALIYAYGGFNVPWRPMFPGPMAAVINAGGLFVHAHLRGGGELGLNWWEEGRMSKKQNTFDDLYAIAEDLIADGRTTPDRLAVTGSSGGGLMASVAITQRPELWRAAVPRVPVTDLLGSVRGRYLRWAVTSEWGDPDDPDDVERLATFSPYHLVKPGTAYPAVYLDVGGADSRCPPSHGRKFAARLQDATSSDRPVFLRVWDQAGHDTGTAPGLENLQESSWLAFVLDQLGLNAQAA